MYKTFIATYKNAFGLLMTKEINYLSNESERPHLMSFADNIEQRATL